MVQAKLTVGAANDPLEREAERVADQIMAVVPKSTTPETAPPAPPPRPVLSAEDTGTTIPPDVLDPRAPLPSVPLDRVVRGCGVTP